MPESGHQLSLADAGWPTASDGEQPFGWRGAVAVTGHNQPLRFLPESGRTPAIAGHDRKDSR